ncbi:MAG: hypothetical protein RBS68_07985 [Anaerolineales bacterium]|jgi:hypothetical protein|nr:hypothetical protein [Anaerolineales bacterium]
MQKIRLGLALLLLLVSLTLLLWASLPAERELRRQYIEPTQMQLPTPQGALPSPDWILL